MIPTLPVLGGGANVRGRTQNEEKTMGCCCEGCRRVEPALTREDIEAVWEAAQGALRDGMYSRLTEAVQDAMEARLALKRSQAG